MKTFFKRMLMKAIVLIFWLACSSAAERLPVAYEPLADINAGSIGSYPSNFTAFAEETVFSAYNLQYGRELWRLSETNISLAADINDTADDLGGGILEGNDSVPQGFTLFSNALYFSAFDPRRGGELWRWNGTNANRAADINADANDTIKSTPNNSWPGELTVLGNTLFFSANFGTQKNNYELWKYDGQLASLAANIHADSGSDWSSYPKGITRWNDAIYFMADDGTTGYELWKSGETSASRLADINPGSAGSFPKYFTEFNNELYFQAFTSSTGFELWKTDGTSVSLVTNLNPGAADSNPEFLTVFNGALYFRGDDGVNGPELWKYDGTVATLVSNLNSTGNSFPKNLIVFSNALFFAANDGVHGWELWKFDGSSASLVADLNPEGDSFPEHLTIFNGSFFLVATTPSTGYELWQCDGETLRLAADINPGPGNSYPMQLAAQGDQLIFSAAIDGADDWEPWRLYYSPPRLMTIQRLANDIELTLAAPARSTNYIQAAINAEGPYTTVSNPIVPDGYGTAVTNFLHFGAIDEAITNRFYRMFQP